MFWNIILWILLSYVTKIYGTESSCCLEVVDHPRCYTACQHVSPLAGEVEQLQKLSAMAQSCPKDKVLFWQCINSTFPAVSSGSQWHGRGCCELATRQNCQNACIRAKSRDDLGGACNPADELIFFHCLEKQDVRTRCCGQSQSSQCVAVCKAIFIGDSSPTRSQKKTVEEYCDAGVASCVYNYTKKTPTMNPEKSLPCCNHSTDPVCQEKCRQAIVTLTDGEEMANEISKHCGQPNIDNMEPMWQCFLLSTTNNIRHKDIHHGIDITGIDGAKLLCCDKASSNKCQDLCFKTYSRKWSLSTKFYQSCMYNPAEQELNTCLQEVEEPCKMGCDGLSFCRNFNHRPTESFHSCNPEADRIAEENYNSWKKGYISLPTLIPEPIPVKDIETCRPETWKAVSCALQVKPCHVQVTRICKEDCVDLLSECLDTSRIGGMMNVEEMCNIFSSPFGSTLPCLSLRDYTYSSRHSDTYMEVSNPCQPNPCRDNEVCSVNRKHCKHPYSSRCMPFTCTPACPMGEISRMHVPNKSYVQIPKVVSKERCDTVCQCGHHNVLHHCKTMACIEDKQCLLDSGRIESHGAKFRLGCNDCVCYGGKEQCTLRRCVDSRSSEEDKARYTGLPCNCGTQYTPVCGANGKTYPSACLASCAGLNEAQYTIGPCSQKEPCDGTAICGQDETCVPRKQVCLTDEWNTCKQYQCVPISGDCNHHDHDPVCDTNGDEFNNICQLMVRGRNFAYRGHCLSDCSTQGTVCGVNGETYSSECAAWADRVPVDYRGKCETVGHYKLNAAQTSCEAIYCPSVPPNCDAITLPGACCPICAAEVRMLYSISLADRSVIGAGISPISIENVTDVLMSHLSLAECTVFGYVSVEGDLVVIIMPSMKNPTSLQIEACMGEAENLELLVTSKSPTLMLYIATSPMLTAKSRVSRTLHVSSSCARDYPSFLVLYTLLFIHFLLRWRTR